VRRAGVGGPRPGQGSGVGAGASPSPGVEPLGAGGGADLLRAEDLLEQARRELRGGVLLAHHQHGEGQPGSLRRSDADEPAIEPRRIAAGQGAGLARHPHRPQAVSSPGIPEAGAGRTALGDGDQEPAQPVRQLPGPDRPRRARRARSARGRRQGARRLGGAPSHSLCQDRRAGRHQLAPRQQRGQAGRGQGRDERPGEPRGEPAQGEGARRELHPSRRVARCRRLQQARSPDLGLQRLGTQVAHGEPGEALVVRESEGVAKRREPGGGGRACELGGRHPVGTARVGTGLPGGMGRPARERRRCDYLHERRRRIRPGRRKALGVRRDVGEELPGLGAHRDDVPQVDAAALQQGAGPILQQEGRGGRRVGAGGRRREQAEGHGDRQRSSHRAAASSRSASQYWDSCRRR